MPIKNFKKCTNEKVCELLYRMRIHSGMNCKRHFYALKEIYFVLTTSQLTYNLSMSQLPKKTIYICEHTLR